MRPTHIEIDTAIIRENLRKIKDSLPEWSTSTAIVKANAYGHGSVMVGRIAAEEGYESLAVAFPEEALPLRAAGITLPIYLLGITLPQSDDLIIEGHSRPAVCESTDLEALEECAARHDAIVDCCIAVDTGMHRIGIRPEDAVAFMNKVESYPHLRVDGFFSHMACADSADKASALKQTEAFRSMVTAVRQVRDEPFRFSMANSAGLLAIKDSLFTDARPGIIQYGIMPSLEVPNRLGLRPALSLYSKVVHVQHLPAGERVGYGGTYLTERPTTIATIPVGYADGIPRSLSNRGSVLSHGVRCPFAGRVCMDQLMVAVPDGVKVAPGDEVVIIGQQGHESITVLEMATLTGTIPYEIFCGFTERVPRVYI